MVLGASRSHPNSLLLVAIEYGPWLLLGLVEQVQALQEA